MVKRTSLLHACGLVAVLLAASATSAVCLDPKDPSLTKYRYPSLEEETGSAVAIVVGTVTKVEALSEDPTDPGGWTSFIYTVNLSSQLKGHLESPLVLRALNDSGGYRMQNGETHLLFISKSESELFVDSCGNSSVLPKGGAVLERVKALLSIKVAMRSNQPLHRDASGGLTAAVVAGERRR
jgi:hypothetical protein